MKNKLLPLLGLIPAAFIQAEETSEKSQPKEEVVVVIGSKIETPEQYASVSVSILDDEEIELMGYDSMLDVLRTQPGVAVSNTGGAGKQSTIRIRGEEGYRTKFYIDGVEISDPSAIQTLPLGEHTLTTGEIGKVEILRGPQGLAYGADAGGIISLTSRSTDEGVNGSIAAYAGNNSTEQANGFVTGGNDRIRALVSTNTFKTDGINASSTDASEELDGYTNQTHHAKLTSNLTDYLGAEFVARHTQSESEYDNCFNSSFSTTNDCIGGYDHKIFKTTAFYESESLDFSVSKSNSEIDRDTISDGEETSVASGDIEKYEFQLSVEINSLISVAMGRDVENQHMFTTYTPREDRTSTGSYGEVQTRPLDNLYVNLGLRFDDSSAFGEHTSQRVSGAYVQDLTLSSIKYRAAYGTGFRAPSLYEISATPAGGLTEEKSQGYEAGVEFESATGLELSLVYFNQIIEDQIEYIDFATGYSQVDGTSRSLGWEFGYSQPITFGLTLSANYTFNRATDKNGDQRLRRPDRLANYSLFWTSPNNTVNIRGNIRSVANAVDTGGQRLDDYEVIDISSKVRFSESLSGFYRIENLQDREYEEVTGFNTVGRSFYAGLNYTF